MQLTMQVLEWFGSSPYPVFSIAAGYLIFVYFGRKLMEKKQPFDLRKWMIAYNLVMVAFNSFIAYNLVRTRSNMTTAFTCNADENDAEARKYLWLFFSSKIVEFLDTAFIILRKKDRQLSFLHIYHHTSVVIMVWSCLSSIPNGSWFLIALVNATVHVIMYSNYALVASLGRSFWWKRWITILQLLQFMGYIVGVGYNVIFADQCPVPVWLMWLGIAYPLGFVILFLEFYLNNYKK